MARLHQGYYELKNPKKYSGTKIPRYRSGWEMSFMRFCDLHPNIIAWASEPVKIPYRNPFDGRFTVYVPDFLITYLNKGGKRFSELIEVKPRAQTIQEAARNARDRANVILNKAKWLAANEWCKRKGVRFRILNEEHIYKMKPKKR